MDKLTEKDRPQLLAYIARQPEYTVFVQGDVENFGLDGPHAEVFALRGPGGALRCVLLRYFKSYSLYCPDGAPAPEAAAFLRGREMETLCGREEDVRQVLDKLGGWGVRSTALARMDRPPRAPVNVPFRMLDAQWAPAIVELELQIKEFGDSVHADNRGEKIKETQADLLCGGHAWGVFADGKLVSVALTSAENSVSAMVIGVATLPAYRGRGFARACVSAAAQYSFSAGRTGLYLFYDNPAAGRIYHALGFADVGKYAMGRPMGRGACGALLGQN